MIRVMIDTSTKISFKGVQCNHFGHDVLYTHLRFSTLEAIFDIDYEVQRQLDIGRRQEIKRFILDAITNGMPLYFNPFIFSDRGQIHQHGDEFILAPGSKLYIIDGQHRSMALSSAINYLKNELEALERFQQHDELRKIQSYIHSLRNYPITLQIYLNLSTKEEQQLFTDVNSTRREAHSGLLLKYDQRDAYNQLTRQVALKLQDKMDIEMNASRLRQDSASITSLTTMKKCLLALFEGIVFDKKQHPNWHLDEQSIEQVGTVFFEKWLKLFPRQMNNRNKYACGLAGVQIALAQTVFMLTRLHNISHLEAIERLQQLNHICSWQITDPLFAHMYNSKKKALERHSSSTMVKRTTKRFLDALNEGGSNV